MENNYFNAVKELYEFTEHFMPAFEGNPCRECNMCCGRIATLGVSSLEFDYIEESLAREGRELSGLIQFKAFIKGLKGDQQIQICPFFSKEIEGCEIHSIRPMSCRTFGCFIGETMTDLIPEECLLKKDTVIYTDQTFGRLMPFIRPFYSLIAKYDKEVSANG